MAEVTKVIDLGSIQQEIIGELQRALGEEAELQQRIEQTRTRIAALRGQLDLLPRLHQFLLQELQPPSQPPDRVPYEEE